MIIMKHTCKSRITWIGRDKTWICHLQKVRFALIQKWMCSLMSHVLILLGNPNRSTCVATCEIIYLYPVAPKYLTSKGDILGHFETNNICLFFQPTNSLSPSRTSGSPVCPLSDQEHKIPIALVAFVLRKGFFSLT